MLIVDDNFTNSRILNNMTGSWGMSPAIAHGGSEALAMAEAAHQQGAPFRLILLDVCMPGMDGFEVAEKFRANPSLRDVTILLLTSAGKPGEAARCLDLRISAYLLKPVMKADLLTAILAVLGGKINQAAALPPSLVTRHSIRESPKKRRVLVAEDNAINQALLVRLLIKLGHASVLARNGKEAVALASAQKFDLVFMDVQMPEMDGLDATRAIRKREKIDGTHLLIYAMTAHAMKGDRERCLEAGMDGYLTKPIRFSDVEQTLAGINSEATMTIKNTSIIVPDTWNKTETIERLGGDEELLRELVEIFVAESPKLLSQLREAVVSSNSEALMRAAHSIRGELSCLGAVAAANTAQTLESMGSNKGLAEASEVLTNFESELKAFTLLLVDSVSVRQ